jgi:hypothetical protein
MNPAAFRFFNSEIKNNDIKVWRSTLNIRGTSNLNDEYRLSIFVEMRIRLCFTISHKSAATVVNLCPIKR